MALEQDIAELVSASNNLTQAVDSKIQAINERVAVKEQEVNSFLLNARKDFPLTPNTLSDTKHFEAIARDTALGTPVELFAAHSSPWGAYLNHGSQGAGTITKIGTKDLASHGISANTEFQRALGAYRSEYGDYYGSDFKVLILDVDITGPRIDSSIGQILVLTQGCSTYTGWGRGEFTTQASCWVNVLECDEGMYFYPSANRSASIKVGAEEKGKGWLYKQETRNGWGGCHQPLFSGMGKMKVAVCLMYVGTGNHGDNAIWADSVGHPYSHTAPSILPPVAE